MTYVVIPPIQARSRSSSLMSCPKMRHAFTPCMRITLILCTISINPAPSSVVTCNALWMCVVAQVKRLNSPDLQRVDYELFLEDAASSGVDLREIGERGRTRLGEDED